MKRIFWLVGCALILLSIKANAVNIVQVAADDTNIPFFLDTSGHVWGMSGNEPVRIKNLEHIRLIAPFIAVDDNGQVFTWAVDDSRVVTQEDATLSIAYTEAKSFPELKNVTHVAHSLNHFYAVVDRKDIYVWDEIHKKNLFRPVQGTERFGPVSKVYSREGVKKIVSAPEVWPRKNQTAFSVLWEDGTVMGFGVNEYGQVERNPNTPPITLGRFEGALDIGMNEFHIAVVTNDGHVKFWGGCDLYGDNIRPSGRDDHVWKYGHLKGVDSEVTEVSAISLVEDDNTFMGFDIFLKKDGTIIKAHAPVPSDVPLEKCGNFSFEHHPDYKDVEFLAFKSLSAHYLLESHGTSVYQVHNSSVSNLAGSLDLK